MTPQQKKEIIQEIPTWTYRAIIGGMMTLFLIWFNDFRNDYTSLKIDHIELKSDFRSHVKVQEGQVNLINRNIQILSDNQSRLFKYNVDNKEKN